MTWFATAAGGALILIVLRDMFHTLGHPSGQGSLSRLVLRTIWRLSRRRGGRGRLARLAGPLALFSVIIVWGTLVLFGWALLFWPSVPEGFVYSSGVHSSTNRPLDAIYISMVTMSTLGFGDITPTAAWLRIATPLEALFGFALLTAAVSWMLQIFPSLTRRRVLALRLSSLRRAEVLAAGQDADFALLPGVLEQLSAALIEVQVDLSQNPETYYFRDDDPNTSLAAALPYAVELARSGSTSSRPDMRLAADLLTLALEDFAAVLKEQFPLSAPTMPELLAAYAADHGQNHQ